MHRSRSRFSNVYAGYHCACSMHRWNSCDYHTPLWSTRKCGRRPFGCAGCPNTCSMSHNSCCAKRSRSPLLRNSGNRLRAGADCWNIPPSFHKNSCDRLRRRFRACSGRNRSYIPGSRFACKWHHFHSPEPMYGFRSPGKSTNHTSRNRGLYTHKSLNSEHNGTIAIGNRLM